MNRLVLTPRAVADLEDMGDFIAMDNPAGAYLILFRTRDDGVEIVRYVHGARKLHGLV